MAWNDDARRIQINDQAGVAMKEKHLEEIVYHLLETELGRVEVYMTALRCEEEDEHVYHTAGWARELWIKSLGMKAVLPPPEEVKDVKTAIGAARAQHARAEM